jgi:electron transport complex protein RnfA
MVLFSGVRGQTESSEPPESFKGLPITLVSAAILSLSFFGFNGVVENLFG